MEFSTATPTGTELSPALTVSGLTKVFAPRSSLFSRAGSAVRAVTNVSFTLRRGETLGLVGESGCGKSTTGRMIVRLLDPTSGSVHLGETDVLSLSKRELRVIRSRLQIVFQDPYASLNPRMTIHAIVGEPLLIAGRKAQVRHRVPELLEMVGLDPDFAHRYPHEFSGGQRQRIGIARALATEPEVLVLDEPVSALDVSIQAGVVNLLADLQRRLDLSYLFIAHDLAVVRHVADVVAVMYLGRIVEMASNDSLFSAPQHPYTRALLSAIPVVDPEVERNRERIVLNGDAQGPRDSLTGCAFRSQCWKATIRCAEEIPELRRTCTSHEVACHHPE